MQRAKKVRGKQIGSRHAMPGFLLDCRDLFVDSADEREVQRLVREGLTSADVGYASDADEILVVAITARGRAELGVLS